MRLLKNTTHPILGDELTFSDRVSWYAQGIIRRWTFIIVVMSISIFWWCQPSLFHDGELTHWNAGASLLALIIESVVGIGMYSQTSRDALIIRRIDKVVALVESSTSEDLDNLEALDRASFAAVCDRLDQIIALMQGEIDRHG